MREIKILWDYPYKVYVDSNKNGIYDRGDQYLNKVSCMWGNT